MIHGIITIANNNAISEYGKLPWMIPEIIQDIKETIRGKNVIIGRETFEFMESRKFPCSEKTFVLSRRTRTPRIKGVSFINAITKLPFQSKKDYYVIGGISAFKSILPVINGTLTKYLVHNDYPGDEYMHLAIDPNEYIHSCEAYDYVTEKNVEYSKCIKK